MLTTRERQNTAVVVLKKYPGIYTPAILYEIIISSTLLRIYFFCLFFLKKLVVIGYKTVQIKKDTDIYKQSLSITVH